VVAAAVLGNVDCRARLGLRGLPDRQDLRDLLARPDRLDRPERRALREWRDLPVRLDPLGLLVRPVPLDRLDRRDLPVLRGLLEPPVRQAPPDSPGHRVLRDLRARRVAS
jgi:hypothetical protein